MRHKEPWRIVVGGVSVVAIVCLWIRKDIITIYATVPQEQLLPMIVTTVAVSLLKITGIAAVVWLGKWIIGKVKTR